VTSTAHGPPPAWFPGNSRAYGFLIELTEGNAGVRSAVTADRPPSEEVVEEILDHLSDRLTDVGFTGDWEITPLGERIEDLIDIFNDLIPDE
jgi:hypothetical protein